MKPYNQEQTTKSEEVRQMFDNIAPTYDSLNHILSMSIDKIWRRNVLKIVKAENPKRVLDIATGTGDLAITVAKGNPSAFVVGVDPSEGMLEVARRKVAALSLSERIELKCGSAESLDEMDNSYDVVMVAFGVRNFGDLKEGLTQMIRSLRPGGKLIVLEFSKCQTPLVAPLYRLYSKYIMPFVGGLLSKDKNAYSYLPESIEEFALPTEFVALMEECGLKGCEARSQSFGIAQIYIGEK